MKILGCDLHAKQQTIAMVDTERGEFTEKTLRYRTSAGALGDRFRQRLFATVGVL